MNYSVEIIQTPKGRGTSFCFGNKTVRFARRQRVSGLFNSNFDRIVRFSLTKWLRRRTVVTELPCHSWNLITVACAV